MTILQNENILIKLIERGHTTSKSNIVIVTGSKNHEMRLCIEATES